MGRTRSGLIVPGVPGVRSHAGVVLPPRITTPAYNPLDIAWAHAYWTEGPEFAALGLADGASVSTWPDEKGTADLVTVTANVPTLAAAASEFNNRPAVRCSASGNGRMLRGSFSSMGSSLEIVVVGRFADTGNGGRLVGFGPPNEVRMSIVAGGWSINQGNQNGFAGTANTNGHLFRIVFGGTDTLHVDETQIVSSGLLGSDAVGGVTVFNWCTNDTQAPTPGDLVFVGLKASLTAQERLDLRAWAQARYATP